jgi:uncharacterized membrane protein SirB2
VRPEPDGYTLAEVLAYGLAPLMLWAGIVALVVASLFPCNALVPWIGIGLCSLSILYAIGFVVVDFYRGESSHSLL